ncbi:hypothetical protein GCM10010954_09800 [Halobacillus andaensis]|uniref:Uncharacterized protein n=1 Tax=Halobacillus andaensis TaxID=1176239 RepID=A0A917B0V6_HALAA|nr:hypothetical protein [Halobacillus andaensis]MBP2003773.1 hypothetical protein [Halobacillus andaensis]GGF13140.1 hypothetical protein GCM10010954_09800 [Halobacillus andaensis]
MTMEIFMGAATILVITAATVYIYKKRKSMNVKGGPKSYVTPAAFLTMPILSLLAYLFDFVGLISWAFFSAVIHSRLLYKILATY